MHELSIALNILEIAAEESERRGGVAVKAIHIQLGPLSGVVTEALASAFELARECSPFGDCRLVIEEVPILVFCRQCQAERAVESIQMLCCARCGTPTAEVVRGRELEITAMEIKAGDAAQGSADSDRSGGSTFDTRSSAEASR